MASKSKKRTRTDRILEMASGNRLQPVVKLTPLKITPKAAEFLNFLRNSSPASYSPKKTAPRQKPRDALSLAKRRLFKSSFKSEEKENESEDFSSSKFELPGFNLSKPEQLNVKNNSNVVHLSEVVNLNTKSYHNDEDSNTVISNDDDADYVPDGNESSDTDEEIEFIEEQRDPEQILPHSDEKSKAEEISNASDQARCCSTNIVNTATAMLQLPPELKQYQAMLPESHRCLYDEPAEEIVAGAADGRKSRKSFCPYCQKSMAQLPRHVQNSHKNELLVLKLSAVPKDDPERQNILRVIRLWGTYIFNNSRFCNKGILKVSRRPIGSTSRAGPDYISCANCGVLIYKRRYGRHYDRCTQRVKAGFRSRESILAGRMLDAPLHRNANTILRERIFPVLRLDNCVKAIAYDEAVIAYANHISLTYSTSTHHDKMIRANLRMLGRVLLVAMDICQDVRNYASLLIPSRANIVRDAINRVADLEETTGTYKHPNNATQAAFIIKHLALTWVTECIKKEEFDSEKKVERFLSILQNQIIPIIDKIVTENRTRAQRKKKVEMPTLADVEILNRFLTNGYMNYADVLKSTVPFNYENWKALGSYCLVALLVFNKRRPGEMDRILLENFTSVLTLDKSHELYSVLNEQQRTLADRNMLLVIRGKLNRTVSVFMNPNLKSALELFASFREQAGVCPSNPYFFGLPSTEINSKRYKCLDSCSLLRSFSKQCGAKNPTTLRATILRKSLATMAASLQLPESITKTLADHMGHDVAIHKNIYRQVTYQKSVLDVASALEKAVGGNNVNNNTDTLLEAQLPTDISSSSQPVIAEDSVYSTSPTINAHPASSLADVIQDPNSQTPQPKESCYRKRTGCTPQKISTQTTIQSSRLTKSQEFLAVGYYMAKRSELNRSPTAEDMQGCLTLPELTNASLPNLMLHLNHIVRQQGTPKKRRYVQSPEKPKEQEFLKRRRNSSKRTPWTQAALRILEKVFYNYLQSSSSKMPSKTEIESVIQKHQREFAGRSIPVVKACLNNMWKSRRE